MDKQNPSINPPWQTQLLLHTLACGIQTTFWYWFTGQKSIIFSSIILYCAVVAFLKVRNWASSKNGK